MNMGTKIKCELCPTECELSNFEIGGCRVRINKDGALYSLVYGNPCSVAVDPIEKKPFFHVLPGSAAFSVATVGCVLSCKFCQNWQISQGRPEESDNKDLQPDELVSKALAYNCKSIAYTYTEPAVFYEYMYDTSQISKNYGMLNTMHTCGYINKEPLRELSKYMDAACVDLKAFTEDFYAKICGGRLKPVLDALVVLKEEGVWTEIVNLVIPTHNDDPKQIDAMCRWIVKNLGEDTPIHFSRFFPYYKLKNLPPTPFETLKIAWETARNAGLKYVYLGNVRSNAENTYCPACRKIIIERVGYQVKHVNMIDGKCIFCNAVIAGLWEV
ncbi:MAG: AmmeMemoRadiSam system radical SAM enzyme [Nitrospirae bacterium]|nr:AmmeMemoRadiSam system radical SAM enzyme [Nitrospirota bacterium]